MNEATPLRLREVPILSNAEKPVESRKMKKQRNMFQMENMIKPQKKILMKQRYIIHLIEFKVMVRKMLTGIGKSMDEHSENFNKERENIKYQIEVMELKTIITELKTADWTNQKKGSVNSDRALKLTCFLNRKAIRIH